MQLITYFLVIWKINKIWPYSEIRQQLNFLQYILEIEALNTITEGVKESKKERG